MQDPEINPDNAIPEVSNSNEPDIQHDAKPTIDALNIILDSQKELHKTFSILQQQMQVKSSDSGDITNDTAVIVSKLDQMQEEIQRQPAQLRGLKRQVNLITSVVGQSRYKSLVERLLNFLDLLKQAQKESNIHYGNNIDSDFIDPLCTELLQILNVNDVDILNVKEGEDFNANTHKCVFTHQVSDKSETNKIYQVVKPGYYQKSSDDEKKEILRHAEVVVTKYCEEDKKDHDNFLHEHQDESTAQYCETNTSAADENIEDEPHIESGTGE